MTKVIVGLDDLAAEPREVTLAGKTYLLPGDVPIPTMLRLEAYSQRMGELAAEADGSDESVEEANREAVLSLYKEVLGLFQVFQPDLAEIPIQTSQLIFAVNRIYGEQPDEEAEEDVGPTRAPSGKTKTRPKTRSRSAS